MIVAGGVMTEVTVPLVSTPAESVPGTTTAVEEGASSWYTLAKSG